jgi:hypothetical protein
LLTLTISMKTHIAILCAAFVVCGCGQATQKQPVHANGNQNSERFEFAKMYWTHGATNGTLLIRTKASLVQTNVSTLEYAADIVGQYGWEFVQRYDDGTHEIFCMKRRAQTDCLISLVSDLPPN